jgi:TIR domain
MIPTYPAKFADLFFCFTWRHRALLKNQSRRNGANDNGMIICLAKSGLAKAGARFASRSSSPRHLQTNRVQRFRQCMLGTVFISHSSKDQQTADAIRQHLESAGLACWIAPRDIEPGTDWTEGIMSGIAGSQIFVLIFPGTPTTQIISAAK